MKSPLLLLWQCAAEELAARCRTSTSRDFETVAARFEHEGESFLTITLPTFGSALEKGLASGRVTPQDFAAFKTAARSGLPAFLRGFLELVFDCNSGLLLDAPNVDAIFAIRQLTLMFGKIELECSKERQVRALNKFVECEQGVKKSDSGRTEADNLSFSRMSRLLWADVFALVDGAIHDGTVIPKHGPGATADRLAGNSKYDVSEWPSRLEGIFPFGEYALPSWRHASDVSRVHFLDPGSERPVKVTLVPKTLKTPRVIAIEPTAMQYMQQAVHRALVGVIQSSDSDFGWLLGFKDQAPNQRLAREGSENGSLATLDLSEASDRVSNSLVRLMLSPHRWLHDGVDACRSRTAEVDGHGKIRLAKFASMGSALTFPIEALVFATVVMLGVEQSRGKQMSRSDIQKLRGRVRVYGDDIVVPVECVPDVIERLEAFGFVVNLSKSFWTGKFRESCGKEYYDGVDVSIVRVRRLLPVSRRSALEVIATTSLRNRCYFGGLWKVASFLDDYMSRLLQGTWPTVMPGASILGRESLVALPCVDRLDRDTQAPLVRAYRVKAEPPESPLDGVGALMKVFLMKACPEDFDARVHQKWERDTSHSGLDQFELKGEEGGGEDVLQEPLLLDSPDSFWSFLQGGEPIVAEDHLERYGRPRVVDIKRGLGDPLAYTPKRRSQN